MAEALSRSRGEEPSSVYTPSGAGDKDEDGNGLLKLLLLSSLSAVTQPTSAETLEHSINYRDAYGHSGAVQSTYPRAAAICLGTRIASQLK